MLVLLLFSVGISLGFVFGAYWMQSGKDQPVTRELYNKIIIASMTWWTTAYAMAKKYLPNKPEEETTEVPSDETIA